MGRAEGLEQSIRPAKLHGLALVLLVSVLGLSFLSGALLWWGEIIQRRSMETPSWMHLCRIVHGCLFPVVSGFFGYLCCRHFPQGWSLKANLPSGLLLEFILLGLIVSSLGLYYAGSESWRELWIWLHRILGLSIPLILLGHWILGRRWGKRAEQGP